LLPRNRNKIFRPGRREDGKIKTSILSVFPANVQIDRFFFYL
jgi:hypothetical protein